jgi:hypothetical protein
MKNILITLILSLLFSCSSTRTFQTNGNCVENKEFKKCFFSNIENIENNTTKTQDQSFKNSLKFLSQYVHVSFESTLNYANTYPVGTFKKDKENWLKWYEENKCNNIKVKK